MTAVLLAGAGGTAALPTLALLARPFGGELVALVAGGGADAEAAAASGVDRVVLVRTPPDVPVEAAAAAVAERAAALRPALLLAAPEDAARALLGAVAARLDAVLVAGVTAVAASGDGVEVTRVLHGGLAEATQRCAGPLAAVAWAAEARPPVGGPPAPVEEVALGASAARVVAAEPGEPPADLAAARRIVAVGRGLATASDLTLVQALADALEAEVACTRPLAEGRGWLPPDRVVGASGRQVAPELYVALGISGQLQHLTGARRAGILVAVNADPHAPILAACDHGIVGDLYAVVPALLAALRR